MSIIYPTTLLFCFVYLQTETTVALKFSDYFELFQEMSINNSFKIHLRPSLQSLNSKKNRIFVPHNMYHQIVIAGIGTEVGKTLISAIVTKALNATYWKPVQTGFLNGEGDRDSKTVQLWTQCKVHPEMYLFQQPLSPHIAAKIDGDKIEIQRLQIPDLPANLVIETAGGLMVPLNDTDLSIDLLQQWKLPVILTVRQYLGNINHTLLSVEALRSRNIPILGIISSGEALPDTNRWLEQYTQIPILLEIAELNEIHPAIIGQLAEELKNNLKKHGVE